MNESLYCEKVFVIVFLVLCFSEIIPAILILNIWDWNLICSLDYIIKGILQLKVLNTLQNLVVNFKTISKLKAFWCRSILSQDVYQISSESNKIKGVTSWRRPRICKWAFLQVLWFSSTLSLIMRIVNGKNKTGGH